MGLGSQLASGVKEGLRPLVDLVYPPRCPMCGDAIAEQGGLCVECWGELEVPGEPACHSCGRPTIGHAKDVPACQICKLDPPTHSGIYGATIYNDASRKLVLSFKHGRKIALASLLGRLMSARLPDPVEDQLPLLIPVPLHRFRIWERGFNQAALLARELERSGKGELVVDGLSRVRRTPSLGGLGRNDREKVLRGTIAVRPSRRNIIAARDVVLVDDVLTSGATSDACVAALLNAGATTVRIACFARVLDAATELNVGPTNETPEV
ncbi:MAG: ComF family protein [Pseudomonadota bacterium]